MRIITPLLILVAALAPSLASAQPSASPSSAVLATSPVPIGVFATDSIANVFKELGGRWTARTGQQIRFTFDAPATLARQIEQGATASIFATSDTQTMDELQRKGLIRPETRVSPIGNTLVLIAPAHAAKPVALAKTTNLAALLPSDAHIAVANPDTAPAGVSARQALTWMGQWDSLHARLTLVPTVQDVVGQVAHDQAAYGIVYGTDAAGNPAVKTVATFPPASHPPMAYAFAVMRAAPDPKAAIALLAFLTGHEAGPVDKKFGFRPLVVN